MVLKYGLISLFVHFEFLVEWSCNLFRIFCIQDRLWIDFSFHLNVRMNNGPKGFESSYLTPKAES